MAFPRLPHPHIPSSADFRLKAFALEKKEKDESDRGRMKIKLRTAGAAAGQRDSRGTHNLEVFPALARPIPANSTGRNLEG